MTAKSLLTDVKVGESLLIDGGRITITLEHKNGQRCKLRIVHKDAVVTHAPPAEKAGALTES